MRIINKIVVHYTASGDVDMSTVNSWHRQIFPDNQDPYTKLFISYHKLIRKDGTIEEGRDERSVGWHVKGYNSGSLGVVLTGSDKHEWYPTQKQLVSLKEVLRDWQLRYKVPDIGIFLHKDLNQTSCPGRLTPKDLPDKKGTQMHQSGKKIGWPRVLSTDEIIIGNPHHSKTIKVWVRKNDKGPYLMNIGPTTYQSIVQFTGYLNLRSFSKLDTELLRV